MGSAEAIWGGHRWLICRINGHRWETWPNSAIHHHCSAPMGVAGERAQGFWSGARGGGEKVSIVMVMDRVARLTTIF